MGINDTNLLRDLVKLSTTQLCTINSLSECICGIKSELGKMNELKDKGNKDLDNRISELENKEDNYITDISYERDGGNIILKYTYVDGQIKTVTLEDKDTVGVLYDDTKLRADITSLTELSKSTLEVLDGVVDKVNTLETNINNITSAKFGTWK